MKKILILIASVFVFGCSEQVEQPTGQNQALSDFVNKVSSLPYRDFRTQDVVALKGLYIDHLKAMAKLSQDDVSSTMAALPKETQEAYETNMEWLSRADLDWTMEERELLSRMVDDIPQYANARDRNILMNVLIAYMPIRDHVEKNLKSHGDVSSISVQPISNDLPVSGYKVHKSGEIEIDMKPEFHQSSKVFIVPTALKNGEISWKCAVDSKDDIAPLHCVKERT